MDPYDLASNKLDYIEPNSNVKASLLVLRYVGTWPPRGRYRALYFFYTVVSFICVLGTYLVSEVAYMITVWGDTKKIVAGAFLLMTNTGGSYKMFIILIRQKRIEALLDVIKSDVFSSYNVEHERILTWYAWYGIRHHVTFMSFAIVTIFLLALATIADVVSGQGKHLPMRGWYPYNTDETPIFEIMFVQQIVGMSILCLQNIAMDTLVTNFLIVTCCQLEILKRNIERIGCKGDDEKFSLSNDEANRKLNSCIEHNKAIIKFEAEIESIFGGPILLQCFVNCAIICVTAYHLSQMTDDGIIDKMGTAVFLCAMICQIFLYCWHGNELTLHSESVAQAAIYGKWWKLNERYKSALRIVLIRSHRPLSLTIGGIVTLSLETFVSILRMSYSFFTLLKSTAAD